MFSLRAGSLVVSTGKCEKATEPAFSRPALPALLPFSVFVCLQQASLRVLVALIQCATMATEVVEVATGSEEEVVILTIVFSTERELFTRQKGHNSRRNNYSAFHN